MTGPRRTERRRTNPRMTKCVACGERSLTFLGHPFYCDEHRQPKPVFTGAILGAERRLIRGEAHKAVAAAIREGRLLHPRHFGCTDCIKQATEYDHRDYTQPMCVEPVCRGCNARRGPALIWTADGRVPTARKRDRELTGRRVVHDVIAALASNPTQA